MEKEKDNSEDITTSETKKTIQAQFYTIESYRSFLDWLFDPENKDGVDWMTQGEAWDMFEKYQDKKIN